MSVEVQPYFAEGERYPALIGVRAEGDEYETAYVSKSELVDALAENAKLRELVREIWRSCPVSEDDCAKCPHRIEESDEDWCDIPILMEALGMEVDG